MYMMLNTTPNFGLTGKQSGLFSMFATFFSALPKSLALLLIGMAFFVGDGFGQTTYSLITSTADLSAGSKYIIVSKQIAGAAAALGYQNTNNRPEAAVTIVSGSPNYVTTTPATSNSQTSSVFELTLGGSSGAWTLTDAANSTALQATSSSSNILKAGSGTWTISFSSGAAVITCTNGGSRNLLMYNNTSSLFSCYTSGQNAVYLYKAASTPTLTSATLGTGLSNIYGTPSTGVSFTASGTNLSANISATAQSGYQVSTTLGSGYGASVSVATGTTVYVRTAATKAVSTFNSTTVVVLSSSGATNVNVTTSASGNAVTAKALTITGLTGTAKIYDGTTTASAPTGTAAYNGLENSESFSVTGTPTYTFTSPNVGTPVSITTTGFTAPSANYTVSQPSLSANITQKGLTITADNVTKVAGQTITGGSGSTAFTSSGLISPQTIGSVTIAYGAGAAAGDAAQTYVGSVTPSAATGGTFTASNYNISYVAGNITVSSSPAISLTGTLGAVNTTYGTPSASPTSFTLSGGNLSGDVTLTPPSGFEISTSIGSGYTTSLVVSPSSGTIAATTVYVRLAATTAFGSYSGNISAAGGGASTQNIATVSSSVGKANLTITGLSATGKTYNANTTASVTGTPTYVGLQNGESFSVTGSVTWAYPNKNVGTQTLSRTGSYDAPSSNYTVTQPSLSATITPATLTVSSPSAANRAYNGSTAATVSGTLSGVFGGDVVSLNTTGTFASANVANGISVTGFSIAGADAGNYTLTQPVGVTANITQASQTISFTLSPSSYTTATANFVVSATATSGLTVTFSSSNLSVATVSGTTITIVGVGTSVITASQAGNTNYAAATGVTQTLTVTAAPVTLIAFEFSGANGDETSATSSSNASNMSSSTLTRGAGISAAANTDGFRASGWSTTSIADAVSINDYMQITLTPNAGYEFSVSSIQFNIQRSATGLSAIALRSSVDNYASNLDAEKSITDATNTTQSVTFSFTQANSSSAVTYRLYGYAEAAAGTGGFEGTGNDIVVTGVVSCITPSQPSIISGSTTICTSAAQTYSVTNVSNTGYTWSLPANWTGSSTTNSINATTSPTAGSSGTISVTPYNSVAGCTAYTGTARTLAVSIPASFTWTGTTSTAWNIATNWSEGIVPCSGAVVTIPNTANKPALSANTTVGNLTIASGATLTTTGFTLTLAGTITDNGIITGSGNVISTGTYTTFTNQHTYTGTTTVSAGVLQLNRTGGTTIPATNSVTVSGGTLQISTNQTLAGFTMSSGGLVIDNLITTTFSGTYSGSGGTLNCLGGIRFTGASKTFPGLGVTVNNGLGATYLTNLEVNLSSSTNAITISTSAAYVTVVGVLTLTNGLITTGAATNFITVAGVISGGSSSSYVNGVLGMAFVNTTNVKKTFPIGVLGTYTPVEFTYPGSNVTSAVTISATPTNFAGLTSNYSGARFGSRYYNVYQNPSALAYSLGINTNGATATGTVSTVIYESTNGVTLNNSKVVTPSLSGSYYTASSSLTNATYLYNFVQLVESAIPLSVTGATTANKTYDGTTTATVTGASLSGVVSPDVVTLSSANATFASANTGTGIAITSNYSLSGANASAYTLTSQPSLTARDITKAVITITANNQNVVYGTAAATVTGDGSYSSGGYVNSETSAVISGSVTYSTNYTSTTASGTAGLTITPDVSGLTATNYSFSPVAGAVSVYCSTNTWIGVTSSAWNVGSNWCSAGVPSSGAAIIIPAGTPNQPVLSASTTIGDLSLASGATLDLNGNILTINGAITGTGTFKGTATSSLVIGGAAGTVNFAGSNNTIRNLTLDASSSATLGATLNIAGGSPWGSVVVNSGATLNTGGNLVLKSTAFGTARIGESNGTISGDVTVERFIPAKAARKYSFIGSAVTQSIRNGWQQQMYITGAGTGGTACGTTTGNGSVSTDKYNSNGFDKTATNTASMFTYNATPGSNGSRWVSIPNTSGNLTPGTGYRVNIRGDRNVGTCADQLNSNSPTAPVAVTLSATGTVSTGTVNVALINPATHSYTLIANPYPSPISFTAFKASNSKINNTMWMYSPFGNGNYTTYSQGLISNAVGGFDNTSGDYLSSGQAFFVEANSSGNVTFQESHKINPTIPGIQYFGGVNSKLMRINFKTAADVSLDEAIVRFNSFGTRTYNPDWDATSFSSGSAVGVLKGNQTLAIATFPDTTSTDSVGVNITSANTGTFKLSFSDFAGIDSNKQILLIDKYVGQQQNLRTNSDYNFTITGDSLSKGKNRFQLLFKTPTSLPVKFVSLQASSVKEGVKLAWKVADEKGVRAYQVQRSIDGKEYETIATVSATGSNTYGQLDNHLPISKGTVYYRIHSEETASGVGNYSSVAKVTLGGNNTPFVIYPNPVKDQLHITLGNTISTNYGVRITTVTGREVMSLLNVKANGNNINLSAATLAAGVYFLEISYADGSKSVERFVKD